MLEMKPRLRGDDTEGSSAGYRLMPHNIEAEQATLGAILVDNQAIDRVSEFLSPDHFYEPLHGRLYEAMQGLLQRGLIATPVTLKTYFEGDEALAQVGGPQYLARLAGAAVTVFDIAQYARLVYDLSIRRELIRIGQDMVGIAHDSPVETRPTEQIETVEQKLFALAERGRTDRGFQTFEMALTGAVEMAQKAYSRAGGLSGIGTGFIDLDRILGGLRPSDLLILAARPSMGKTAFATNIAFNAAKAFRQEVRDDGRLETVEGAQVGFFSLEMSSEQLAMRILAEQSEIPSDMILHGRMGEEDFFRLKDTAVDLQRIPLFIDDTPGLTITSLTQRARRLKRQKGLDLIVIDYLQLIRSANASRSDNRVQEVSEVTQGLKALAKELSIPVLALSQLSRQVENREDKRPQLSDLRESGSIEQDADVVMFIFREEYYHMRAKPSRNEEEENSPKWQEWEERRAKIQGIAEILIGKQRNGPIGTVELLFESKLTKFANLAQTDHYPEIR
jgi:replicative DNA helicase